MSAANWPACIAFTLAAEGGVADDADDPGGLTKFGISAAAYPELDIAALTEADAGAIYRRDYWARIAGDALPPGVDLMVFDMAVNAGVGASATILQRCVGVDADGAIGPVTLLGVRGMRTAALVRALGAAQLATYQALPGWAAFGRGWAARLARRLDLAVSMTKPTPGETT